MWLTQLARSLGLRRDRLPASRARHARPLAPPSRFVPGLTALEGRTVPSAFTVSNLNDAGAGSLRAAVVAANANPDADTITFKGALQGTIALASQLSVTEDVTITGPGAGKITVSGGGTTRVFNINGATTDAAISGLTIADGSIAAVTFDGPYGPIAMGGGILNNQSHLVLSNVTMTSNRAIGGAVPNAAGGAVANVFGATLAVTHSTFTNNTVGGGAVMAGGAIYCDTGGSAVVEHSTFADNQAVGGNSFGGAISCNAGDLVVSQCAFDDNLAQGGIGGGVGFGGAVDVEPIGFFAGAVPHASIDACVFRDNRAVGGTGADGGSGGLAIGGAVDIVTDGSEATVSNSLFRNNLAQGGDGDGAGGGGQGDGGALDVFAYTGETGTVVTVDHCHFDGNVAHSGTGGEGDFASGWAFGGAINNSNSVLNVRSSSFTNNEARGGDGRNGGSGKLGVGGAITGAVSLSDLDTLPTTNVTDSVFVGNKATGGNGSDGAAGGDALGGALFNILGTLTVERSSLVGNVATGGTGANGGLGSGGAIQNGAFGVGAIAIITDTHFVANQAVGGAGVNGGDAHGGGLTNDAGAEMTLTGGGVHANRARGGSASGGSAGTGTGGGIFNGGLIFLAPSTHASGNQADAFDDCFGCS